MVRRQTQHNRTTHIFHWCVEEHYQTYSNASKHNKNTLETFLFETTKLTRLVIFHTGGYTEYSIEFDKRETATIQNLKSYLRN